MQPIDGVEDSGGGWKPTQPGQGRLELVGDKDKVAQSGVSPCAGARWEGVREEFLGKATLWPVGLGSGLRKGGAAGQLCRPTRAEGEGCCPGQENGQWGEKCAGEGPVPR